MESLPIHPESDLNKYIIESSDEKIVFLIPFGVGIDVDLNRIADFEDVRSCTDEMLSNGNNR